MAPLNLLEEQRSQLRQAAFQVAQNAYAPYSQFRVGAAVLSATGNIFVGCNVESASYGLSQCAERAAICAAIAAEGATNFKLRAIAIAHAQNLPLSPCGACRQVIQEFGTEVEVIFSDAEGQVSLSIAALLPHRFQLE